LADFLEEVDGHEAGKERSDSELDADQAAVADQFDFSLDGDWEYLKTLRLVLERAGISEEQQMRFLKKLRREVFTSPNSYIVREGTMGDKFYIIITGDVVITKFVKTRPPRHKISKTDSKGVYEEVLTHLYPGHFFGERSLLREIPRNANVKVAGSCSQVIVMSMSKDRFKPFIENDPNFKTMIGHLALEQEDRRRKRSQRTSVPGSASLEYNTTGKQNELKVASVTQRTNTQNGQYVINDWMTRRKLGKGSFGTVFLVQSITDSSKTAALKRISRKLMRKAKMGQGSDLEVLQEVAVMKMLTHKHVVNLLEVIDDTEMEEILIVQEYMEYGPVMTEKEYNQPLEILVARKYFREMLLGLEYLHYQGVVHRDVKPSNLLVGSDGVCRLADFGAAALTEDAERGWVTDVKGTPAFQPPECFAEEATTNGYSGFAHDIWSLGATLHTMVVGVPPFMAANELELVQMLKTQDFRLSKNVALDPHLQNLLQRMLTKDPTARATLEECLDHDWVTQEGSDSLPSFTYTKLNLKGALEDITRRMGSSHKRKQASSPLDNAPRRGASNITHSTRSSLPPLIPNGSSSPRDVPPGTSARGSPPMRQNRSRSHTMAGRAPDLGTAGAQISKSPDVRSMNRPVGAISAAANVDGFSHAVGLGTSSPVTGPVSHTEGIGEFVLDSGTGVADAGRSRAHSEAHFLPANAPATVVQQASSAGSLSARQEYRTSPLLGEVGVSVHPPRLAAMRGHKNSTSSPRMMESPRGGGSGLGGVSSANASVRRLDLGGADDSRPATQSQQVTPREQEEGGGSGGRQRLWPGRSAAHSRAVSVGRAGGLHRPTTVGVRRGGSPELEAGAAASGVGEILGVLPGPPRGRSSTTATRPTAKRVAKRASVAQSAEAEAAAAAAKRHLRKLRQRQLSLIQGHEGVDSSVAEALLDQKRFAFHAARAEMIVEDITLLGDDGEDDFGAARTDSNIHRPGASHSPAPLRQPRSEGGNTNSKGMTATRKPSKSGGSNFASTMDTSPLATHLAAAKAMIAKEAGREDFGPKPTSATPQHQLSSGSGSAHASSAKWDHVTKKPLSPAAIVARACSGSNTPGGGLPRATGTRGRTDSEHEGSSDKDRSLTNNSFGHNRRRSEASVYSNADLMVEEGLPGAEQGGLRQVLESGGAGADFATIDSGTPKTGGLGEMVEEDFVPDITILPKTPAKAGRGRQNSTTSDRSANKCDRRASNVTNTEPQAVTDTNVDELLAVHGEISPHRGGVPGSVISDEAARAARMHSNISDSAAAHYSGGTRTGSVRHTGSMKSMGTTPGLGNGLVATMPKSLTKQGTWVDMKASGSPGSGGGDGLGALPTQRPRLVSQYSETTRTSTSLSTAKPVHNVSDLGIKSPEAGVQPLHGRGMATPMSSTAAGHAKRHNSGFFSPPSVHDGHGTPASSSGSNSGQTSQRSIMTMTESDRRTLTLQRYNDFVMVNVKVDSSGATGASQKRVIFRARDPAGFSLAGAARTRPNALSGLSEEALAAAEDSEIESVTSDVDGKGGFGDDRGSPKTGPTSVGSESTFGVMSKPGSFRLPQASRVKGANAMSELSGSEVDSSSDSEDDYLGICELDDLAITNALDELADAHTVVAGADEDDELALLTPQESTEWAKIRHALAAEAPRQYEALHWTKMNNRALVGDTSSVRLLSRRQQEKARRLARSSCSSEGLDASAETPASPGSSALRKLQLRSSSVEDAPEEKFEAVQLGEMGNPAVTMCETTVAATAEGGVDAPSQHIVFSPAGCNKAMGLLFGAAMLKGQRITMEDRFIAVPELTALPLVSGAAARDGPSHGFFAVCDGHNGDTTAEMVGQLLAGNVVMQASLDSDPVRALTDAFLATDQSVLEQQEASGMYSGSTAVSVLLRWAPGATRPVLYCANVGDSRAVMSRAGSVVALSDDHTCMRPDENKRLLESGGYVTKGRLMGVLAVSRAFGDAEHKNIKEFCWGQSFSGETLLAEPEIVKEPVSAEDELKFGLFSRILFRGCEERSQN
jgi:[calcium/calmodulin-dependent protein kinase] kinase